MGKQLLWVNLDLCQRYNWFKFKLILSVRPGSGGRIGHGALAPLILTLLRCHPTTSHLLLVPSPPPSPMCQTYVVQQVSFTILVCGERPQHSQHCHKALYSTFVTVCAYRICVLPVLKMNRIGLSIFYSFSCYLL